MNIDISIVSDMNISTDISIDYEYRQIMNIDISIDYEYRHQYRL